MQANSWHNGAVTSELDVDSVRAFARRDWSAVARLKEQRRATRLRDDPMSAAHLAWAAYDYRCEVHGEGVDMQRREADLAHHIHLKALLDRVAVALR